MMSGFEEAGAGIADLIAEYGSEEAAAAAIAAAAAEGGAAAGTAAAGLTAADLAAMSSVGGGAELGGMAATDTGLLGSGTFGSSYGVDALDKAGASHAAEGYFGSGSTPYGAGSTVTDSMTAQPGQGPGMYEDLKYKALNALNKTGGAYNKLPGPVQGMLASSAMKGLLGPGEASPMAPPNRPPAQGMPPPQSAPTYNAQPYQAQSFGSSYGGQPQGLLGMSPEQIAMLKKMLAGGSYA